MKDVGKHYVTIYMGGVVDDDDARPQVSLCLGYSGYLVLMMSSSSSRRNARDGVGRRGRISRTRVRQTVGHDCSCRCWSCCGVDHRLIRRSSLIKPEMILCTILVDRILPHSISSVHWQNNTGHPAGIIACQHHSHRSNIFSLSNTAKRVTSMVFVRQGRVCSCREQDGSSDNCFVSKGKRVEYGDIQPGQMALIWIRCGA